MVPWTGGGVSDSPEFGSDSFLGQALGFLAAKAWLGDLILIWLEYGFDLFHV